MPEINAENINNLLSIAAVYFGIVFVAAWAAMVVWVNRDMRARSRDRAGQLLVTLLVLVFNFAGLLIYIFLRPRETLSEAYERSLEEEALLQEIEEKPSCPGCKQRVDEDWQVCPACHTRLKKACVGCGRMLELSWTLCPYCATPQSAYSAERSYVRPHVRPGVVPEQYTPTHGEALEFIDGED